MSRTRIVKGIYTKISAKGHSMYSNESIITTASNFVTEEGTEKGLSIGLPKSAPKLEYTDEPDFDIELELIEKDFVPLGIPDYKGNPENDKIQFELTVTGAGINQWHLTIKNGEDILYESFSASGELQEVLITAKTKHPQKKSNDPKVTTPVAIKRYWPAGKYILSWTGFNKNGIYDSTVLKSEKGLTVSIVGQAEFKKKTFTIDQPIKFTHKEADWVDVRIDKINKKIDTTLRVNLKDGGEEGLECKTQLAGARDETHWEKKCPWDEISHEALNYFKEIPIKTRTKTFEDLKNMALEGINTYWSRTYKRTQGKGTSINDEKWEIIVNATNDKNGMVAPDIIYFTNSKNTTFNRSHNWELHRELYYKVGYTYYPDSKNDTTKGWYYRQTSMADLIFKETSAHEIGHQLLLKFGGRSYSYTHKGSSGPTWIQQDPLPGTKYGTEEIDLMKYAEEEEPKDYHDRLVLSQEDSRSMIWFTKLKVLSIFLFISSIWSCQFNKTDKKEREKVNYFNGIVLDENKNNLPGVKVVCILQKDSSNVRTTITNKDGYFKIWDKKFENLKIEDGATLIFSKEGYVSDTVETTQPAPEYKKYPNNYFFIHKEMDTIIIKKKNK